MMHQHKRMTGILLAAGMLLNRTGVLPVPAMTVQAAEAVRSGTCGEDRKSTRLNSSHITRSRMPSSA